MYPFRLDNLCHGGCFGGLELANLELEWSFRSGASNLGLIAE